VPCAQAFLQVAIELMSSWFLSTTRCGVAAGASAGIGRAVALALNENGVTVTVLARRKDRLDAVVQQLHGVSFWFHSLAVLAVSHAALPAPSLYHGVL
jgi:NADP-dependent 3-hydroxy acid dehydrogenase YdfG